MRYNFEECLGEVITLNGKISQIPWQHLIGFIEDFKHENYFDLDNGEQIVIYTRTPILCRGTIKVKGTINKTEGKSKRPQPPEDNYYYEYQMLVETWECLN